MTEFNFTKIFRIKGTGPQGERNVLILGLAALLTLLVLAICVGPPVAYFVLDTLLKRFA